MKTHNTTKTFIVISAILLLARISLFGFEPVFTYHGRLVDDGVPVNGSNDLQFVLYDAATLGTQLGTLEKNDVEITNGLFTVLLNFGAPVFDGSDRWLEIGVRPADSVGDYTILSARHQITPTPYSIYAASAANISGNPTLTGTITFNPSSGSPFLVGNSTKVQNLNVDLLDGLDSSAFWQLGGNAGTTPAANFLGTADNQPLELRVNNQRVLRLEATPGTPNVVLGNSNNLVLPGVLGGSIGGGGAADLFGGPRPNQIAADYGVIGGGLGNIVGDATPFFRRFNPPPGYRGGFCGSSYCVTNGLWAGVAAGMANRGFGDYSTISGGFTNLIARFSEYASIGGGWENAVEDYEYAAKEGRTFTITQGNTISGGIRNRVQGWSSSIAGGEGNGVYGGYNAIGGGARNGVGEGNYSTIGGGDANYIYTWHSTVGGGAGNGIFLDSEYSTIGGGVGNFIDADALFATISGGERNTNGYASSGGVIAGGNANHIEPYASYAAIGGGFKNRIAGSDDSYNYNYGTIAGGHFNYIGTNSFASAVAGGYSNNIAANSRASAIGGGENNRIAADSFNSTIRGGGFNDIGTNSYSSTTGGYDNDIAANSWYSTIAGGSGNDVGARSYNSAIGGGENNNIGSNSFHGTIAGGRLNDIGANSEYSAVSGGRNSNIGGNSGGSTIAGGDNNNIGTNAANSVIGGGWYNNVRGNSGGSTISGGYSNAIDTNSPNSVIGGGYVNNIAWNVRYGTIAGGYQNTISPDARYAAIPGGARNRAAGEYSFAAGYRAKAIHGGAFVWADSQEADFLSVRTNEVAFRCGGVRFTSGSGGLNQAVTWQPGGSGWFFSSDRNLKEDIRSVDTQTVLEKLCRLPMAEWRYKGYAQQHIGPMAQDFHALFRLNDNDTMLDSGDLHGVALAAIQGLNKKLEEQLKTKDTEIRELRAGLAELKEAFKNLTIKTQE